jgi:acetylornithine deacetylase/succinyl-diaminopimelate desuccinylase-like protein
MRFTSADAGAKTERRILTAAPFDPGAVVNVSGGINRPPLERSQQVKALYTHARALASFLDFDLGEASVGGASDGNFVAALGVPVLDGLGVQGDGAHAAHEHIFAKTFPRARRAARRTDGNAVVLLLWERAGVRVLSLRFHPNTSRARLSLGNRH